MKANNRDLRSQGVTSTSASTSAFVKINSGAKGSGRPSSAKPLIRPPKNQSSIIFDQVPLKPTNNGIVNLRTMSSNCDFHGYTKSEKKRDSTSGFERGNTQPGRYMKLAKDAALRRRHRLVLRQGELLEKEHLYDC